MFTRDRTETVPIRTGPDRPSVYLKPFGTGPCVYTEAVRGTESKPAKKHVQFWILSGPVAERSRVNRRPTLSNFPNGSIWIQSRVNITLMKTDKWPQFNKSSVALVKRGLL